MACITESENLQTKVKEMYVMHTLEISYSILKSLLKSMKDGLQRVCKEFAENQ